MSTHTSNSTSAVHNHGWRFFRAGGFDQVRLDRGADLAALPQLDQKLWVALSCPTRGLEFDTRTLDLIDIDGDGRIRATELLGAVQWACRCLKDPEILCQASPSLRLEAINADHPEGAQILKSARSILASLGKADAAEISVADASDPARVFGGTGFNGDGVVPADATEDPDVRQAIEEIIACVGAAADRSGKPGVDEAHWGRFFAELQAYSDWRQRAEADATIHPLGDRTAAAAALLGAVREKVEDYFARCRLAAFDARALNALNREEKEYLALAAKDLTITVAEVIGLPLARIEADKPLPLDQGVNPGWAGVLAAFQADVVQPLLGKKTSLTEADWDALKKQLAPYESWMAAKAGAAVEKLGLDRVRALLAGRQREAIQELIARDKALEPEFNAIAKVEKLVRLHRDLYLLLNNYVAFRDFYTRRAKALFQAGTLYLDQRSCDLCLKVEDPAKHGTLAALSQIYLAYCDLTRRATGEKMTIAAAFTDGDSDRLMVGRNGIFYDRQGRDWDATITKIVDHPISIRQAIWSPYKKFLRLIEELIGKLASAREKAVQDKAASGVAAAGESAEAGKAPARKEPFDIARFAGIFAAIGLALAALGGAIGGLAAAFSKLPAWQIPLVFLGIMVLISGPSVVIAWLKLRQRSLAPLLDASGWAVNARARLNIPFGKSLTGIAKLPPGSHRDLRDPYAEKRTGRTILVVVLVVAAAICGLWYFGVLNRAFPGLPKSGYLQRIEQQEQTAPAAVTAPAAQTPAVAPAAE